MSSFYKQIKMAYYEDIVMQENGKMMCTLCNTLIPDNDKLIDSHINDKNHTENFMRRLLIRNNISLDKKICCLICVQNISNTLNLMSHIQSSEHKNKLCLIKSIIEKDGAFIELPVQITFHGNNAHCLICNQTVNFTLNGINKHVESVKHRWARSVTVQPFNSIFSVEGSDDDLWCKVCQVYLENYVEIIFEHVDEDPKHIEQLGKILKLIEGQNINIEKYLTSPKEDKALCRKCQIEVPCNVDNLERHINGKKHNSITT